MAGSLARNWRYLQRCSSVRTQASHISTEATGSPSREMAETTVIQPTAPIFNRREKRKLRNAFPRPDKTEKRLYPALPASFVNRITMADGSSFYLTTRSPRQTITLARDVTNHPLWNPSLAREVADQDQSGRMGRFARRYAGPKLDPVDPDVADSSTPSLTTPASPDPPKPTSQASFDAQGFGIDDLDWISGSSSQSFYGIGNAKNIKGLKKSPPKK